MVCWRRLDTTFDPASGKAREFVSGYHNAILPNLWDRSRES